ncbi:hypothetical protein [Aliarcobacter sp.]
MMLKKSFKQILKAVLVMFFVGLFGITNVSATITGNNTLNDAYVMGYWEYYTPDTTWLEPNINEAYYKFTASAGDKIYARTSYNDSYLGMTIETLDSTGKRINLGDTIINTTSNYLPFLFANADADINAQTFYIKVTRGSYTGDMYFTVTVEKRIYSANGTFDFVGTASNPGNPDILTNPNGVDSSIINMNLTNNSSIPNGAIVKSITTTGTVTPSKGGILHKISSSQNNIWYTSSVLGSNYPITVNDDLEVKKVWSFKYNQKALGASTMKNVKATINYEYDITDGF